MPTVNMLPSRRQVLRRGAALAAATMASGASPLHAAVADKIKIGFFGTAHSHAGGKAAAIRKMPELFEVVGVVEPDEHLRPIHSKRPEYDGLPFTSEEQLLNTPGLAAVLIETAVKDLIEPAIRFASAGLHIHLEKPGSASLPAMRKLLDELARHKRILQLGYMFRRNPAFEICFQAAREGWLGDIYEINAIMGKFASPGERRDMIAFPGGTMFELGCHLIDAMVTLLGKPTAVHSFLRKTHPAIDDLADNALAVCEYSHALATIRSADNDVEGSSRRQFVINGDLGTAAILPLEPPQLRLRLKAPAAGFAAGTHQVPLRKMPGRFEDQLHDFAQIIRGDKPLDYPPEHDLAVLETVLQASGMSIT